MYARELKQKKNEFFKMTFLKKYFVIKILSQEIRHLAISFCQ